jgi:hypothetical protein
MSPPSVELARSWPTDREIKALLQFASTDFTRPHMVGMTMKLGYLWTTDGYCCARIKVDVDDSLPVILCSNDGEKWVTENELHPGNQAPPYEHVWPEAVPPSTQKGPWGFNPGYFARIDAVERAATQRAREIVRATSRLKGKSLQKEINDTHVFAVLHLAGQLDPCMWTFQNDQRWAVIIMPRRV